MKGKADFQGQTTYRCLGFGGIYWNLYPQYGTCPLWILRRYFRDTF